MKRYAICFMSQNYMHGNLITLDFVGKGVHYQTRANAYQIKANTFFNVSFKYI